MKRGLLACFLLFGAFFFQWSQSSWLNNSSERIGQIRINEREKFRGYLASGQGGNLPWPGLRRAQVSWAWLELLQGLHIESSYEGDFSWMFSKLHFLVQQASEEEIRFLVSLAPFYFVIGKDGAGATLIMNEMVRRLPEHYHANFWAGFHALENLLHPKMASFFYAKAAESPFAPDYLSSLAIRLRVKDFEKLSSEERLKVLEENSSDEVLQRVKNAHPQWFQ